MTEYDLTNMSETARNAALQVGRVGLSTRGIAFAIIGGFIFMSAVCATSNGEITGISEALAAVAAQTYGKSLMGITGDGLMRYAVHMFLMARYRKFEV